MASGVGCAGDGTTSHRPAPGNHRLRLREDGTGPVIFNTIPVHFLTCGQHDATNKFANVSNVILAGTLIKPNPVYETLGRLAAALPSSSDPFEETATVKRGEHCHGVLQANARECCLAATERRCAANPIFVNAKNVLTTTVTNAKAATRPAPRNLNVRRRSSRS